jgi:uroporphyrinogen decarboxylase
MTRRERVLKALAFEETDRPPMDLGGMLSSSISCFAYPSLVKALGLPPRRPRVHDTYQMLAMSDLDVLDALDCDVVSVFGYGNWNVTSAFDQPGRWRPYDFNGRLDAKVLNPESFEVLEDATIVQPALKAQMPPDAYVFDAEHGGQPIDLSADIPKPDLAAVKSNLEASLLTSKQVDELAELCRRAREASDRAILFQGPMAQITIMAHGGIGIFPLLCLTEPEFVAALHEMTIQYGIQQLERLLPSVRPYIDVYLSAADDWGSQNQLLAAPHVYEQLFMPYYRKYNDAVHAIAPEMKTQIHCCGAVYDILDLIISSGFDILNPVQWTAGGHSYQEWKDKCGKRIALWGGGVNAQDTLVRGTVADIEREVTEVARCLKRDGGFVFSSIHNILAEIPGEKVVAMYRAARACA